MLSPTVKKEKSLWRTGYRFIAGVDEVGRGAWAGPVVVGAVVFNPHTPIINGVCDSKLLTENAREKLFPLITENARAWAVGIVTASAVDRIGIVASVYRAMQQALTRLSCTPDHVLTDALPFTWRAPCTAMIDGDTRVYSIAAASVVAKVFRDRLMIRMHRKFPQYGFYKHKGYGTREHVAAIQQYGISSLHRRSFVPARCFVEKAKKT